MGKLVTVQTSQILPSQDYLKQATLEFILGCIENEDFDNLPPPPIVRFNTDSDSYIAIDGHNLIAVYDFLQKDIEVYVAESAMDAIEPSTPAVALRNQDLAEKYDSSVRQAKELQKQGLNTFKQLRNKYPDIGDEQK